MVRESKKQFGEKSLGVVHRIFTSLEFILEWGCFLTKREVSFRKGDGVTGAPVIELGYKLNIFYCKAVLEKVNMVTY